MNKKTFFISITVLIVIVLASIYYFLKSQQAPQVTQNDTTEILKANVQTSKDPAVMQIRKVLNSYLYNKITGTSDPKSLINGDAKLDRTNLLRTGLKNFSKDYYKSKFVAYSTLRTPNNGEIVYLEFIDKPDKVFTAEVLQSAKGSYELQYLGQNLQITNDTLQSLNTKYAFLFNDKAHAL